MHITVSRHKHSKWTWHGSVISSSKILRCSGPWIVDNLASKRNAEAKAEICSSGQSQHGLTSNQNIISSRESSRNFDPAFYWGYLIARKSKGCWCWRKRCFKHGTWPPVGSEASVWGNWPYSWVSCAFFNCRHIYSIPDLVFLGFQGIDTLHSTQWIVSQSHFSWMRRTTVSGFWPCDIDTPGAASASAACATLFYPLPGYVKRRIWMTENPYPIFGFCSQTMVDSAAWLAIQSIETLSHLHSRTWERRNYRTMMLTG